MTPKRIRRQRTRGWRMPENAVYVGRPTLYGNPYVARWEPEGPGWVVQVAQTRRTPWSTEVGSFPTCARAVQWCIQSHQRWLLDCWLPPQVVAAGRGHELLERRRELGELPELTGRDLACWCALDQPCHADLLLALANEWEVPT